MDFRKDINGLRAYAVIAVILFHLNNNALPGGFAGVDVFFVISGFLMTKIIVDRYNKKTFSLLGFYAARAKRIVPALTLVCLSLVILGYLFLYPSDYAQLGEDSLSSLLFLSNVLYFSRAGYFDDSSLNNLLLHTWSLSVEWQFYIIYPLIILLFISIFGSRHLKTFVILFTIASFAACVYGTYNYAEMTYFMFPTRAWAMLAGGCAYFFNNNDRKNKYIALLGFILVICSFFIIDKNTPWPGEMSLLPVIGAAIIIYSNKNNFFLDNKLCQYIGTISYELYLVHWSVFIFAKKLNLNASNLMLLTVIFILSALLHYVCNKTKQANKTNTLLFFISVSLSFIVIYNSGFAQRVPEQFRLSKKQFHQKYYGGSNFPANIAFFENATKDTYKYIFAGDSFALQYASDIKASKLPSAEIYSHGCLMLPDYSRYLNNKEFTECSQSFEILRDLLNKNKTATLVYTLSWDTYAEVSTKKGTSVRSKFTSHEYESMLEEQIERVIKIGGNEREYFFIGRAMPASIDGFACLSSNSLPGYKLLSICAESQKEVRPQINQIISKVASNHKNVHFIDPNDYLCSDNKCAIISNSEPVYSDHSHLSIYGSKIVFDKVIQLIK